jgi:hypothetical protein
MLSFPLGLVVLQDTFVYSMSAVRLWLTITRTFMVRTLKILTNAHTNSIVRGQSTLRDNIERYFWNGLSRELEQLYMNAMNAKSLFLNAESTTTKVIPNCIYSMHSTEQHYGETEVQNSDGCPILVSKKDVIYVGLT